MSSRHSRMLLGLVLVLLSSAAIPVQAAGTTWRVTVAGDDGAVGDPVAHTGTVRFALEHAIAGDVVIFGSLPNIDTIYISSTLIIPPGVSLGATRDQSCTSYTTPIKTIADSATQTLNPMISLGAGATLRNIGLLGGKVAVQISGSYVDICGVGIGVSYDGDGALLVLHPSRAALIVDGDHAFIHRSYIGAAVSVSPNGSDSEFGDSIVSSTEANAGVRDASVTILADANGAAQRVLIRDPFPRALHSLIGNGIAGGDDIQTHANNWAQTPTIISALTADNYATVQIHGVANPNSQVDIFFDNQVDVVRQAPVMANANGEFSFSGPLPTGSVKAIAVSTLNDPTYPGRVGSSSQWSNPVQVSGANNTPQLHATASLIDRNGTPTNPGDVVRLSINVSNPGSVDVSNISASNIIIPAGLQVVAGSGSISGGSGFSATDSGFGGGTLTSGQLATYTLQLTVAPQATGAATISGSVSSSSTAAIPISAQVLIGATAQNQVYLPLIVR